jgi:uncharacterized membrane protein YdjX (TVP38/TMEM64 family)
MHPPDSLPKSSLATVVLRWAIFVVVLLAFILVPFALFEGRINSLVQQTFQSGASLTVITLAVIGFLVADIVLPIPSSFVLTTTGYLLGVVPGTAVCFIGMTVASVVGYWLGRYAGGPLAQRVVGRAQLGRFAHLTARYGDAILVAFRAVPVLAEATTLLAGISRMSFGRFLMLVSLGNAVVSLLYAWIGAVSASQSSFVIASIASIVLPIVVVLAARGAARA